MENKANKYYIQVKSVCMISMVKDKIKSMSDQQWKQILTPEQYKVCRKKKTELPFSGKYHNSKEKGIYYCICCGNELFTSNTKFDSGTGWPSFYAPIDPDKVKYEIDNSHNLKRMEAMCSQCGAHLGHVFDDGPFPTKKRYCINSVSLKLNKEVENTDMK